MLELITMLPDAFIGGCGKYMMRLIAGSDKHACPAGICRHCRAVINLNNYICPSCSCSYPFIDISNVNQSQEVTRSVRTLWQQLPKDDGTIIGLETPHRVPPTSHIVEIKTLMKMYKRKSKTTSIVQFNQGKEWASYAEMFQHDPNWNGTMSRGGWTIHNIHLLDDFIQMAFVEYGELQNSPDPNYFNRRSWSVKAYYAAKAQEFLELDPTLSASQLQAKCQALCNSGHQLMMEHRAKQFVRDPSARFPTFWSPAVDSRPFKRQRPNEQPSQASGSIEGFIGAAVNQ